MSGFGHNAASIIQLGGVACSRLERSNIAHSIGHMTNRVGYWTDNRAVLLYTLFITARTSALIGDSEFCARA